MFLKDFRESPYKKITKINSVLKEQYGISISKGFPNKSKLEKILESAEQAIIRIRGSNKMFHLEPDYAKFLGIKDIVETMINEGMYAESPAHNSMKEMVETTVRNLMDSGYTMDEAVAECMNRYRMDDRFAYDDDHVMPIVITAAKNYMDECSGMKYEAVEEVVDAAPANTDINEKLLKALAEELGVKLEDMDSLASIERTLEGFAKVSGKSRDAVVGFLNGLDESAVKNGIQFFGRKVAEANAFVKARKDAIKAGKKKFTVGDKEYDVTGDTSDELEEAKNPYAVGMASAMKSTGDKPPLKKSTIKKAHKIAKAVAKNEGLDLDSLLDEMLNEEVDIEQAEVVMAVRAMADDIQDQVERIGRMINEELPAIVDQMRSEMGASTAQAFSDTVTGVLTTQLENAKTTKVGLDNAVAQLTGGEMAGGLGDTGELAAPSDAELAPASTEEPAEPEMDTNEPAAAGPKEEPLGRAAI